MVVDDGHEGVLESGEARGESHNTTAILNHLHPLQSELRPQRMGQAEGNVCFKNKDGVFNCLHHASLPSKHLTTPLKV